MIANTGTCDNCCDPDSCLKNDLADQNNRSYTACHHHDQNKQPEMDENDLCYTETAVDCEE